MFSVLLLSLAAFATTSLAARATFYGGNLHGGACSFSTMHSLPAHVFGTALSGASWESSKHCGACVRVHGPNGHHITAMIVDECPECPSRGLDLFPNAFAHLGPKSKGVLDVSWEFVKCPIHHPLQVHLKEGVSPYWFSAQIVDANKVCIFIQPRSFAATDGFGKGS